MPHPRSVPSYLFNQRAQAARARQVRFRSLLGVYQSYGLHGFGNFDDLQPRIPQNDAVVALTLLNNSAGDLNPGDLTAIDPLTPAAVIAINPGGLGSFGYAVALDVIPRGSQGRMAIAGDVYVRCSGSVGVGEFVQAGFGAGAYVKSMHLSSLGMNLLRMPAPASSLGVATSPDNGSGYCRISMFPVVTPRMLVDPSLFFEIFSDFLSGTGGLDTAGVGATETYDGLAVNRLSLGVAPPISANGGVIKLTGDSAGQGPIIALTAAGGGFPLIVDPAASFILDMKIGQATAGAGTRRFGLFGTAPALGGEPANGIYVRFTAGGAYTFVCRKAGVETVLVSTVGAADGTIYSVRIAQTVVGVVECIFGTAFDTIYAGQISSNLPIVSLGWGASASAAGAAYYLDTLRLVAARATPS